MSNNIKYYVGIGENGTFTRQTSLLAKNIDDARVKSKEKLKSGEEILEVREWRNTWNV